MVKIMFDDTSVFEISLVATHFTKMERVKRTLQGFFLFFGIACLCVFIPVLHLVLVPACLLLSFVVAYIRSQQVGSVDLTGVKCPKCSTDLNEKMVYFQKEKDPKIYCYECRQSMRAIEEKETPNS